MVLVPIRPQGFLCSFSTAAITAGPEQETHVWLWVQVQKTGFPDARIAGHRTGAGLGFRGHCEDEKNREKPCSLDFLLLLCQDKSKGKNSLIFSCKAIPSVACDSDLVPIKLN